MPYNLKDAEQSLKRLFPEEYEKIQSNRSYYQRLNESKVGLALDWIDLGLDVASIIPGPIGTSAAVAGTVIGIPQGLLAIGDGFTKGWNAQNISDAAKILPGGAITGAIAKKGLAFLGKSDKYARRANPYFTKKSKTLLPDLESGIDMVRRDKKYLPYFLPTWGADAANIGTDIIHILSNKIGGKVKKANARKWKHLTGGRLDIKGLMNDSEFKKNHNLYINPKNISITNDSLINRGANNAQIGAVLTLIISESGGETKPHGNGAYGLIGWRGERAKGLPTTLSGQLHHLMKGLFESHKDWSDGGPGMNIGTGKEMQLFFKDGAYNNYRKATNAVMNGYVRPPEDLKAKRHALVLIVKQYMK